MLTDHLSNLLRRLSFSWRAMSLSSFAMNVIACATFLLSASAMAGDEFTVNDGSVRVNNWGYQLQGPNNVDNELRPAPIAAAVHDLMVIDYARFGDEDSKFTPTEVSRMQHSHIPWGGDGQRKVLLSYVSIGEVSDFRSFWNPIWTTNGKASGDDTIHAPDWLGPINPDWPESRKVRFWDPDWQDVIFNDNHTGWLDQVVTQGFDGAYFDIVDAYYYWFEEGERTELQAAQEMIDFIVAMAAHTRQTNPEFLIFPQNAPGILDVVKSADPSRFAAYINAISAIGIEDLYFYGNKDMNNRFNPQQYIIDWLHDDFLDNGVPVFVVDYVNQTNKLEQLYDASITDRFYPFASPDRDLSFIIAPGPNVPDMQLNVDQLIAGAQSVFQMTGGKPNTKSYFVYSTNTSSLSTFAKPVDLSIFMLNPKTLKQTRVSDSNGDATWSVNIPLDARGKNVRIQVVQQEYSSDVVSSTIQ